MVVPVTVSPFTPVVVAAAGVSAMGWGVVGWGQREPQPTRARTLKQAAINGRVGGASGDA